VSRNKQFFKGGAVLAGSQFIGQFCSLGRNVIIARIVTPVDFGIAAIFVMVVTFLEMMSNFSLDRLLVQDPEGDDLRFQQVAQLLQAIRGIISSLLIFFSAVFLANLFSIPEAKGAFYVLALVPFFTSFHHLDPKRIERKMIFWPGASVEMASQLLVLLLAWPVAKWFGDYRAMLALLVIKQVVYMAGTHLVARRPYRWAKDKKYLKQFWNFGGPLLLNGLLMFVILQGDRFLMGAAKKTFGSIYDMGDVGVYSTAFMLTMIPAMMVIKVMATLLLPVLSRVKDDVTAFTSEVSLFNSSVGIIASVVCGLFLLVGDKILVIVYGVKYGSACIFVSWLSVLWAFRMLRVIPASVAMAQGHTKYLLYTNLVRSLALFGVVFVVALELPIVWVAIAGLCGEVVAYFYSLLVNKFFLCVPLKPYFDSSLHFIWCLLVAIVFKQFVLPYGGDGGFLLTVLVIIYVVQTLFFKRKVLLAQLNFGGLFVTK